MTHLPDTTPPDMSVYARGGKRGMLTSSERTSRSICRALLLQSRSESLASLSSVAYDEHIDQPRILKGKHLPSGRSKSVSSLKLKLGGFGEGLQPRSLDYGWFKLFPKVVQREAFWNKAKKTPNETNKKHRTIPTVKVINNPGFYEFVSGHFRLRSTSDVLTKHKPSFNV